MGSRISELTKEFLGFLGICSMGLFLCFEGTKAQLFSVSHNSSAPLIPFPTDAFEPRDGGFSATRISAILPASGNSQIYEPVVGSISVDVVNVFSSRNANESIKDESGDQSGSPPTIAKKRDNEVSVAICSVLEVATIQLSFDPMIAVVDSTRNRSDSALIRNLVIAGIADNGTPFLYSRFSHFVTPIANWSEGDRLWQQRLPSPQFSMEKT